MTNALQGNWLRSHTNGWDRKKEEKKKPRDVTRNVRAHGRRGVIEEVLRNRVQKMTEEGMTRGVNRLPEGKMGKNNLT